MFGGGGGEVGEGWGRGKGGEEVSGEKARVLGGEGREGGGGGGFMEGQGGDGWEARSRERGWFDEEEGRRNSVYEGSFEDRKVRGCG